MHTYADVRIEQCMHKNNMEVKLGYDRRLYEFFWATRLPTNVFDWLAFSRGIN